MNAGWHIISKKDSELPEAEQEIYCCIFDGDAISTVKKAKADLTYLEELLHLHPSWKIFWQPLPPPPKPPSISALFSRRKEAPYGKFSN